MTHSKLITIKLHGETTHTKVRPHNGETTVVRPRIAGMRGSVVIYTLFTESRDHPSIYEIL
jgi:hypothetical protein